MNLVLTMMIVMMIVMMIKFFCETNQRNFKTELKKKKVLKIRLSFSVKYFMCNMYIVGETFKKKRKPRLYKASYLSKSYFVFVSWISYLKASYKDQKFLAAFFVLSCYSKKFVIQRFRNNFASHVITLIIQNKYKHGFLSFV